MSIAGNAEISAQNREAKKNCCWRVQKTITRVDQIRHDWLATPQASTNHSGGMGQVQPPSSKDFLISKQQFQVQVKDQTVTRHTGRSVHDRSTQPGQFSKTGLAPVKTARFQTSGVLKITVVVVCVPYFEKADRRHPKFNSRQVAFFSSTNHVRQKLTKQQF